MESMSKLDYLVTGRTVAIFTDRANLVYLFDPYGKNPGMARHKASKLIRWALKLSGFRYVIEHLAGERNVWADMLSRWAVRANRKICAIRVMSLLLAPITPSLDEILDWPTRADIGRSQRSGQQKRRPVRFKRQEGIFQDEKVVFGIPEEDPLMQLRIIATIRPRIHSGSDHSKIDQKIGSTDRGNWINWI